MRKKKLLSIYFLSSLMIIHKTYRRCGYICIQEQHKLEILKSFSIEIFRNLQILFLIFLKYANISLA